MGNDLVLYTHRDDCLVSGRKLEVVDDAIVELLVMELILL